MTDPNLLMYAVYDSEDERWLLLRRLEEGERAAHYWDVPPLHMEETA